MLLEQSEGGFCEGKGGWISQVALRVARLDVAGGLSVLLVTVLSVGVSFTSCWEVGGVYRLRHGKFYASRRNDLSSSDERASSALLWGGWPEGARDFIVSGQSEGCPLRQLLDCVWKFACRFRVSVGILTVRLRCFCGVR